MSTSPAQSPSPADPPGRIRLATWHRGHVVAPSSKRPRGWLSLGGLSGAAYILPDRSCMGNHSDTLGVTGPGPAITCIKICIYIYIQSGVYTKRDRKNKNTAHSRDRSAGPVAGCQLCRHALPKQDTRQKAHGQGRARSRAERIGRRAASSWSLKSTWEAVAKGHGSSKASKLLWRPYSGLVATEQQTNRFREFRTLSKR